MTQDRQSVGLVAMAVAVCSWAGFALSIRGAATSTLSQADLALIRFGVPLLLLAPWLPASVRRLRRQPPAVLVAIVVGAGLPHLCVSETGGGLTSAGLVGLVIPGSVPLFVALVAFVVLGESIGRGRILSLGTIGLGIVVTLLWTPSGASVAGIVALLAAGLLWSVYTVTLRQASLRPLDVVVVVSLPSAVATAALVAGGLVDSRLLHGGAEGHDVLGYALALGVLTGIVSTLCYSMAVTRIGTRNASMLGALSPVLAGVAAVPLFGEWPDAAMLASLALITAGVLGSTMVRATSDPRSNPNRREPAGQVRRNGTNDTAGTTYADSTSSAGRRRGRCREGAATDLSGHLVTDVQPGCVAQGRVQFGRCRDPGS